MMYKQPYLRPYTGKESRTVCPQCKKPHSFTLYLDGNTGQPISPTVGICNHYNSCGYHYPPKQYFIDNPQRGGFEPRPTRVIQRPQPPQPPKPMGLIPIEYLDRTQSKESNFVYFLTGLFKSLDNSISIEELCRTYKLGATKDKRVIFWQIDINGNVRTGKIMQYNPTTGKRVHNASGAIDWIHNTLKRADKLPDDYNLKQCYFGEHLLNEQPDKIVAITEAEKTAIICSVLFPQMVWIGAGNLNGLTVEKSKALKGRSIMLFPDLSNPDLPIEKQAFTIWSNKADEIRKTYGCKVVVSDILEKNATDEEKRNGLDIADYLIKQIRQAPDQVKVFQQPPQPPQQDINNIADELEPKMLTNDTTTSNWISGRNRNAQGNWDGRIMKLETFFNSIDLPSGEIRLSQCEVITDVQKFVNSHLAYVKRYNGNITFEPYLLRLEKMKNIIQVHSLSGWNS